MSTSHLEQELKEEGTEDEVCASCGIAGVDNVKLKNCACNLVKYCTVDCQKNDRPKHKKACKKRLTELHDKQLFTQPDISYMGECPLCCLPLPLNQSKSTLMGCCCKVICDGCNYANQKRELLGGLEQRCAFCREPAPESDEEVDKRIMERVKKNDPVAMTTVGKKNYRKGDYEKAFEYYTKAADLGDVDGHCCLGSLYYDGQGVEKDMKKAIHHWEQAAIGGHPGARGLLADYEMENGRMERTAKHWIINANLGDDDSLKPIKVLFVQGIVSKEEYASALRGHQAAVDATKSVEREKAAEAEIKEREENLIHDKQLFTQPDSSHWGECPICCLPMPLDASKSTFMSCCSKSICKGCEYANVRRENEQGLEPRCAFCREVQNEHIKRVMKRIKKNNDPLAMTQMGKMRYNDGDYEKAFEYWTKAIELGDVAAHFCLGRSYYEGNGVEKDMKKAVHHLEQAAIGGHAEARYSLGRIEVKNGRLERAAKHFIIAANLGCDKSLKLIKDLFVEGIASKDDYAAALRGYQAAVDATKSAQRDEAETFHNIMGIKR